MTLEKGKSRYSLGTFDCDNEACAYHEQGRCIYQVACIKIEVGRACHNQCVQDELEAYLDYLDANS